MGSRPVDGILGGKIDSESREPRRASASQSRASRPPSAFVQSGFVQLHASPSLTRVQRRGRGGAGEGSVRDS